MHAQQGYTPKITHLYFEQDARSKTEWMTKLGKLGGWDPETSKLVPMNLSGEESELDPRTNHVLDSIAAGIEFGIINEENFPMAAFATEADFQSFRDDLVGYADQFWVNDRYFNAFIALNLDESSVRNFADLADALADFEWA